MRIGFIGLGRMGLPMATNLVRAGHEVTAYNRSPERTALLTAAGGVAAATPAAAARDAEVLVTMVADDDAATAVLLGDDGALAALPEGAVHASMSTLGIATVTALAERHAAARRGLVAAPVFGRPEAAAAAKLWIVAAGTPADVERCRPAFAAMGQAVIPVGEEPALAATTKLAGNFLLASTIEALAEALALVRASGGDAAAFMTAINSLFGSRVVENYGRILVEERYEPAGFALRLGLKDVRLVLAAADAVAAPMPLAGVVRDHFLAALNAGLGDADWAALGRVAAARAGLPRTPEASR